MGGSSLVRQDASVALRMLGAGVGLAAVLLSAIVLAAAVGGASLHEMLPGTHLSEARIEGLPFQPSPAPAPVEPLTSPDGAGAHRGAPTASNAQETPAHPVAHDPTEMSPPPSSPPAPVVPVVESLSQPSGDLVDGARTLVAHTVAGLLSR